jgi:hypothetical protein
MTSPDGITWTCRKSTETSNRYGITASNSNLVRLDDNISNSLEVTSDSYYQSGYSSIGVSITSTTI